MAKLSTRDKEKPLILIAAIAVGVALNQLIGSKSLGWMMHLVEFGVFVVILAVMMPVELVDVGRSFRKVKPTTLALAVNFLFIPVFSWSMGWLFLREYPDFWAGIVLYTLTPCIGWYLIFIDIAKGDVPWGMALIPLNITLQILLLPFYLYVLVGKVIPLDLSTLARSVGLFLIAPFALSFLFQRSIIARKGRDYFFGPVKRLMGEVKLWALVLVIVSMFASEGALQSAEFREVGLLILVLILFFVVLFLAALAIGRVTNLGYEDTVTLAFTTTARNSEAVIGVAVAAFPGHPLVYFAIILGPIVELPILLLLSRVLLTLKERFWQLPAEPVKGIY